ncbi:hypothetical protein Gotri_024825 [Gossypium trilobum]|uniref:RNase H type-1 domain-containing protein n=1 Tax=Gossypium trilobum TaxID=34281 RepID=A0A7J9FN23_9ROSI|nr:hypothetical protein [Gossypium trilobum]
MPSAFTAEAIACWKAVQVGVEKGWQFQHTPRSTNNLAHILPTETLRRREEIYLEMGVPEYAKDQTRYDGVSEPD